MWEGRECQLLSPGERLFLASSPVGAHGKAGSGCLQVEDVAGTGGLVFPPPSGQRWGSARRVLAPPPAVTPAPQEERWQTKC